MSSESAPRPAEAPAAPGQVRPCPPRRPALARPRCAAPAAGALPGLTAAAARARRPGAGLAGGAGRAASGGRARGLPGAGGAALPGLGLPRAQRGRRRARRCARPQSAAPRAVHVSTYNANASQPVHDSEVGCRATRASAARPATAPARVRACAGQAGAVGGEGTAGDGGAPGGAGQAHAERTEAAPAQGAAAAAAGPAPGERASAVAHLPLYLRRRLWDLGRFRAAERRRVCRPWLTGGARWSRHLAASVESRSAGGSRHPCPGGAAAEVAAGGLPTARLVWAQRLLQP